MTKQVVGIDVGKAKLDVGVNGEKGYRRGAMMKPAERA
jgi:hypothetical protein